MKISAQLSPKEKPSAVKKRQDIQDDADQQEGFFYGCSYVVMSGKWHHIPYKPETRSC